MSFFFLLHRLLLLLLLLISVLCCVYINYQRILGKNLKKRKTTKKTTEDLRRGWKKYYLTPFCWFLVILLVSKTKTFLPYIDSYPNLTFSWKQLLQKVQNGRINDNRTNPEHAHPLLDVSTLTLTPLHPNHRYLCTFPRPSVRISLRVYQI